MTVCHCPFSSVPLPLQVIRMSRYLNMKQLYFLLFLAALYGIGLWIRGRTQPAEPSSAQQVSSSYEADFRNQPYRLSPLASCQQGCRSLSDSSLTLMVQYGAIKREQGDTLTLQGKDLSGADYQIRLVVRDTLYIETISMHLSSYACECPR